MRVSDPNPLDTHPSLRHRSEAVTSLPEVVARLAGMGNLASAGGR